MYIDWSGRQVNIYNEYNAKMSVIYTDTDVVSAVLQGDRQIVVITKDRTNVYKRVNDSYIFNLWTSTQRIS